MDPCKYCIPSNSKCCVIHSPWGKHTPAHYKELHAATHAHEINKDAILPIVTIRHPWHWLVSMCKNPYTARWAHNFHNCPHVVIEDDTQHADNGPHWNPVQVTYGAGVEKYTSLIHMYNDWYREYVHDVIYPRVIIRMEDLVFYTPETITAVCTCAGGKIRTDRPFQYIVDSAKKDSPGHDTSVGLLEAWIRYSRPLPPHMEFSDMDYQAILEGVDQNLVDHFHYQHPL
jgi:hypothetical protein